MPRLRAGGARAQVFPNPTVIAWYVVAFSWTSHPMGGCSNSNTGPKNINLYGFQRGLIAALSATAGGLSGVWCINGTSSCKALRATPQAAGGADGTTKTVSGPAPGGSTTVDSPPFPATGGCAASPAKSCLVDLTWSAGERESYGDEFALEGEVIKLSQTDFVVYCWLLGDFRDRHGDEDSEGVIINLSAADQLRVCLTLASVFLTKRKLGAPLPARSPARAVQAHASVGEQAATGCLVKRIGVALHTRNGRVVSGTRAKNQRLTASSVRYSCSATGSGLKIKLTGPSKGTLRQALGTKLDLQVYRSAKTARRNGKLSVKFHW